MTDIVKRFGDSKTAVLINGKCIMHYVKLNGEKNRMEIARKMFAEYPNYFSNVGEVVSMLRAYEKTGDFVWNSKVAYITHQA